MENPFRFGTIVEGEYFTDRQEELAEIKQKLASPNHLTIISPRRFGKSSLVLKAVKEMQRPYLMVNLQNVVSQEDLVNHLLRDFFRRHKWEKAKHLMSHFRFIPTVSVNPMTDGIDVAFNPTVNSNVVLEDVFRLLENSASPSERLIVVFDEFQDVLSLGKGLDRQLRAIMQQQQNINYIFLGSQESMMEEIFEKKKSPFYHFGALMRLHTIPQEEFNQYIIQRLKPIIGEQAEIISTEILNITHCHPYYTQLLASQVWELIQYQHITDNVVNKSIDKIISIHDLDYERLWLNFNNTDRRIIKEICQGISPLTNRQQPSSTNFSTIKRLMRKGYVIKNKNYQMEDPFFKEWVLTKRL